MKVQVSVATDRRRGLWSYELTKHTTKGRQTIRNAGSLPHAHAHTLAIVAITSALRSISVNSYKDMVEWSRNAKPTIEVVTQDESLRDAIETATQVPTTTLRAGANFIGYFSRQARRFDLRIEAEPDNNRLRALIQWARQVLPDPSGILAADAIFAPSVASAIV
jgi:hypothetical protein